MRDMQRGVVWAVVVIVFTLVSGSVQAADLGEPVFGIRAGVTASGENFQQYEVFAAWGLPWQRSLRDGWELGSDVELSGAVLHGADETGAKAAGAVDLLLFSPQRHFSMLAGMGAGLQSREQYGDTDFGGPFYFLFQAGFSYWLTPSLSVGYRFHHESNGSIYSTNPSLNLHQIEVRFLF